MVGDITLILYYITMLSVLGPIMIVAYGVYRMVGDIVLYNNVVCSRTYHDCGLRCVQDGG